jgi:hypothetical protein
VEALERILLSQLLKRERGFRERERERERGFTMVYYFKARPELGDYTIYMGLDKFENEDLIKYGWPEDIWYVRRKVCKCLGLCFLEILHVCFFLMERLGLSMMGMCFEVVFFCVGDGGML